MLKMGDLQYSKIKNTSVVEQTISFLTDAIMRRELRPGDKIPTEVELADKLGVSRNTVREGVKTLVFMGVLEIRRPEGTFVCKTFKPHSMNPLIYSMILKQKESYQDLIGLRECIDFGTHQVIMEQGLQPDDAAKLREIATSIQEELDAPNPDAKLICQTDIAFHDAIAKATHNELIVIINDMLSKLTYGSRIKTIEHCIATNDRKYLVDIHFEMLKILEEGNTDALPSTLKHSYSYWANLQMEE